jgi:hypothetical protein
MSLMGDLLLRLPTVFKDHRFQTSQMLTAVLGIRLSFIMTVDLYTNNVNIFA